MKRIVLLLLIVTSLGAAVYFINPSPCGASCEKLLRTVDVQEFSNQVSERDIKVIDVRTPEEYASGHIDGSINSNYNNREQFSLFLDSLDKKGKYLIYCRSGNRSGQALQMMGEKGFMDVTNLSGGILAWQAASLPLTSQ